MRKGKFDIDSRPIPLRVRLLVGATLLLAVLSVVYGLHRARERDAEPSGTACLVNLAPALAAAFIIWTMNWRDELEKHDASDMAVVALAAVAAQLLLGVGTLEWAAMGMAPVAHLLLALRNGKGLYIAWRKQLVPVGRVKEMGVALACAAAIAAIFTHKGCLAYGHFVANATVVSYAAAALSVLVSWASSYGERFPSVNSTEMWRAAALLGVAEAVRGASMAALPHIQGVGLGVSSALVGMGLAAAGVSAHRRKYLRKPNAM